MVGLLTVGQTAPKVDASGWGPVTNCVVGWQVSGGGVVWTFRPKKPGAGWRAGAGVLGTYNPMQLSGTSTEVTLTAEGVTGIGSPVDLVIDWFTSGRWVGYSPDEGQGQARATITPTATPQTITLRATVPAGVTEWKPNITCVGAAGAGDVVRVARFAADVTATTPAASSPGGRVVSATGVEPGGYLSVTPAITGADTLTPTVIGPNTQDQGVRDPCLQPGTALAPVNVPLVKGVKTQRVPEITYGMVMVNWEKYSHSVFFDPGTQNTVDVVDVGGHYDIDKPGSPQTKRVWRMKPFRPPAQGSDKNLQVMNVQPDGTVKMLEAWQAEWKTADRVETQRLAVADLNSALTGPRNGIRAFDGPCITGLIREHEVDLAHTLCRRDPVREDAPMIPHALAISLDMVHQLGPAVQGWSVYADHGVTTREEQPGWNPGRDRFWFNKSTGYRWPAAAKDGFAGYSGKYAGPIWMGSRFCIPSNVDINSLGLNWAQFAIARALQDYGAYVLDANNGGVAFYLEFNGRTDSAASKFNNALPWNTPGGNAGLVKIVNHLQLVVDDTEATPGGGPLTAPRRRPFAAPLAAVDPGRPHLDPSRLYLM